MPLGRRTVEIVGNFDGRHFHDIAAAQRAWPQIVRIVVFFEVTPHLELSILRRVPDRRLANREFRARRE